MLKSPLLHPFLTRITLDHRRAAYVVTAIIFHRNEPGAEPDALLRYFASPRPAASMTEQDYVALEGEELLV